MMLIVFLIFIIISLFLYYLFFQKLPIKQIAKKLGAKYQIFGQNGLFSFSSLFLDLPQFYACISKSKVGINPFGIFCENKHLLTISLSKVQIHIKKFNQLSEETNTGPTNEKLESKSNLKPSNSNSNFDGIQGIKEVLLDPRQEIKTRLFSVILFYLFKLCNITISNIEIIQHNDNEKPQEEYSFSQFIDDFKNQKTIRNSSRIESSITIHYERKEESKLTIDIGDSYYESNGQRQITINKFGFALKVELIALFDLISQSKAIFLAKSVFSSFQIELHDSMIEIKEGSIDTDFYPGIGNISHTSIQCTLPYQFPTIIITMQNVNATTHIPFSHYHRFLSQKEKSAETNLLLSIEEFNVKIVSDHFLNLKSITLVINDLSKLDFDITVSSFSFHYSTLDGLQIFPLYKQLRDPVYTPSRIRFAFPENGHMSINTFSAKLYLTDEARVKATSTNVIYSNKALQFPLVQLKINKHQMAKVKQFSLSSPDETFLTFSADYVVAHDRKEVPIGFFIMNIIYAWRIIKPWASRNEYDSETLPFPIHVDVKKVCAKFHDNPVNIKLATLAGHVFQPFLQEKYVMQLMFDNKIQHLSFSSQQLSNAKQKLSELYFNTYKE